MALTITEQRAFVTDGFARLANGRQYEFLLLLLDQLLAICRETFPRGLPTRWVPYGEVDNAVARLWERGEPGRAVEVQAIADVAEAWLPVTPEGYVEHEPGAALGYHVADLIARLARVDVEGQMDEVLEVAWEALHSLLFRISPDHDYSRRLVDADLDATTNGSLLLEYQAQRTMLDALDSRPPAAASSLRTTAREAALVIAGRERNFLVVS